MQTFLWDGSSTAGHYVWRDYDWKEEVLNGDLNVLSNYLPLYTKAFRSDLINSSLVIENLINSHLIQPGGILTSLDDVGQQWDCPNAWPPLQQLIIEAIATTDYYPIQQNTRTALQQLMASLPELESTVPYSPLPLPRSPSIYALALSYWLSSQWILSNEMAYKQSLIMFEKYYALVLGSAGAGGEYPVQAGFGWTNGVALIFIDRYKASLNYSFVSDQSATPPIPIPDAYPCMLQPHVPSYLSAAIRDDATQHSWNIMQRMKQKHRKQKQPSTASL